MKKHHSLHRPLRLKMDVPIYGAKVWLIVTGDLARARKRQDHLYGACALKDKYYAMLSYGRGDTFSLFFDLSAVDVVTVAHEVFHLTHRILDWASVRFDADNHESGALLNGWLMGRVCAVLGVECPVGRTNHCRHSGDI